MKRNMYCGTDIIEVSRIKDAIINTKGFKENVFTENEIKDIDNIKSDVKFQRYAGRFAAKEAIYKAMSKILIKNNLNANFLDVEVLNENKLNRRPCVVFLNEDILKLVKENNINIDISISHVKEMAVATAILTLS